LIQINEGPRLNDLIQINGRSREGDILWPVLARGA
jgi:hypothetical protein